MGIEVKIKDKIKKKLKDDFDHPSLLGATIDDNEPRVAKRLK